MKDDRGRISTRIGTFASFQQDRLPVLEEISIFRALCLYWCDVGLHMYPILVSGDSILGTKVSGFDFWRFILGAEVSVLISGNLHLERLFIWISGRV